MVAPSELMVAPSLRCIICLAGSLRGRDVSLHNTHSIILAVQGTIPGPHLGATPTLRWWCMMNLLMTTLQLRRRTTRSMCHGHHKPLTSTGMLHALSAATAAAAAAMVGTAQAHALPGSSTHLQPTIRCLSQQHMHAHAATTALHTPTCSGRQSLCSQQ